MEDTELLTLEEVARRLRVHPSTVGRWLDAGALKHIELPRAGKQQRRTRRVFKSEIDKLFPALTVQEELANAGILDECCWNPDHEGGWSCRECWEAKDEQEAEDAAAAYEADDGSYGTAKWT